MVMDAKEFDRLNVLSERLLFEKPTSNEMIEFYVLFDKWNSSDEFNLFDDFFI